MVSIGYQIVVYNNRLETLERTLSWIAKAADFASQQVDVDFFVTLGDCSPTQAVGSDEWKSLQQRFSGSFHLEYVYFGCNLGHGGAQNSLSERLDCDYLLFANPDILMLPDAITLMLSEFESNESLAALDAKQIPFEHPKEYDIETRSTSWCSGAFMMVRSLYFHEVEGFDDATFFMHGDDVDLSWRLRLAGYQVKHQPLSVVFHPKFLTVGKSISSSPAEPRYSALTALLLPWKWSRDDVLASVETQMISSQNEFHTQAIRDFAKMRNSGRLPKRIDRKNRVAEFNAGNYSKHRWV